MLVRTNRAIVASFAAFLMLAATVFMATPSQALFGHHHAHGNFAQRHATLMGVGAGVATHHMLKVAAARDKARGKKLNWAERHPTMTGIGAGVLTHHLIKRTVH